MKKASYSSARRSQRGVTLIEALASAVIIFIVLAAAIVAYFLSVFQSVREIIDTEVKSISRSVEHAIRAAARANLAPNRKSFFADIEGVRIFIPLPQPGQPAVDLPDYNEDINGDGIGPDIDWDGNGLFNAPAFAKPESSRLIPFDINGDGVIDMVPENRDGRDNDGDGVIDDGPNDPSGVGSGERMYVVIGGRAEAYNGKDEDGDNGKSIPDDYARWLYPYGLLAMVNQGSYKETGPSPTLTQPVFGVGTGNWSFQPSLVEIPQIVTPLDEDLNGDGIVSTAYTGVLSPPTEAGLVRNPVPSFLLPPGIQAFFPDTFEDRNGDGRITVSPAAGGTLVDINGDGIADFIEYSEDFNLNGFLDVPAKGRYPGSIYYHGYYGPGMYGAGLSLPGDPLSQGLLQSVPLPAGSGNSIPEPYQTADFVYAQQIEPGRNFGYSINVQRVEDRGGGSKGFGGIDRSVYRFTVSFYFDYEKSVREFRNGGWPEPVRVQSFEVIVE